MAVGEISITLTLLVGIPLHLLGSSARDKTAQLAGRGRRLSPRLSLSDGYLSEADVRFPQIGVLSDVLHPMLQYGKARRASLAEVGLALEPVLRETATALI